MNGHLWHDLFWLELEKARHPFNHPHAFVQFYGLHPYFTVGSFAFLLVAFVALNWSRIR